MFTVFISLWNQRAYKIYTHLPRKLIIVAIISALDVMIATPKNKISAACV